MASVPLIKIELRTRCFACKAHGVYLGAIGVVFAETADQARTLMFEKLCAEGLWKNQPDDIELTEIPMTGAHVLWNGDY